MLTKTVLLGSVGLVILFSGCGDTTSPDTSAVSLTLELAEQEIDGEVVVVVEAVAQKLISDPVLYMWDCIPIPRVSFFASDGKEARMAVNLSVCDAIPHPEEMPEVLRATVVFDGWILNPEPPYEVRASTGEYTVFVRFDYMEGPGSSWKTLKENATFDWPPAVR